MIEVLKNTEGAAIVYCSTRRRAVQFSDLLNMHGFQADHYHAGLTSEQRDSRQQAWITNTVRVIVCTNAFGMGIDKPDVRAVIHADPPDCLESYYQEAGRAGRDGKKSYAVLLHSPDDAERLIAALEAKYPSQEEMKAVYQSVANYLQVPSGGQGGASFEFDVQDFSRKFKVNIKTAVNSLKLLEQEGWVSFSEQFFLPPMVQVVANRRSLEEYEQTHPADDQLIKTLLRSYEGIFDIPVPVSESFLARALKTSVESVRQTLSGLHAQGVIAYVPQSDSPRLTFTRSRVNAADLLLNVHAIQTRKQKSRARLDAMLRYVDDPATCRSQLLGRYFGDDDLATCGVCDNCLRVKRTQLTRDEFARIRHIILAATTKQDIHCRDIPSLLREFPPDNAWKSLRLLQDERLVEVDPTGWIRLKNAKKS
jgi:ATP-dependent DNA helicase RecQ